ncbi:MAG: hypothetical protein ACHQRM_03145 [Bacteroidia bacterium]
MKIVSRYLLLSLLFFTSTLLHGQGVLVFSPHHMMGFQHTVAEGSSVTDSVIVKDSSAVAFHGTVVFHISRLDSTNHFSPIPNDTASYTLTIPSGFSQTLVLHRTYGTLNTAPSGPYRTGINVIVIWPSCPADPSAITSQDSLRDTVYITSVAGIQSFRLNKLFELYPNPCMGQVRLSERDITEEDVDQVWIYDEKGRICGHFLKQIMFDLSYLQRGSYLVEVLFRDGKRGRRKLILE